MVSWTFSELKLISLPLIGLFLDYFFRYVLEFRMCIRSVKILELVLTKIFFSSAVLNIKINNVCSLLL